MAVKMHGPEISEMRYLVILAKRQQKPDSYVSIVETLVGAIKVHAKIEDVYPQTFLASAQTDTPLTHMIWTRWIGGIDQTYVVIRVSNKGDGTSRMDLFRIRRVKELDGRKRFLQIEAELEVRE